MILCDYCKILEAKYQFKSGKWRCSESLNCCPEMKRKNSFGGKGKKHFYIQGHPRPHLGKKAWNSGKKMTPEYCKNVSNSLKGIRHSQTEETKKKISAAMKNNPLAGGYRVGSGVGKGGWYESPVAGRVYLDSSYERRFANFLDSTNLTWGRNYQKFPYGLSKRVYIPDFFFYDLNNQKIFLEIKGYVTENDKLKWIAFPHVLYIIKEEDLIRLEKYENS